MPIIKKANIIKPQETIIITDGEMQDISKWNNACNLNKVKNLGKIHVVYVGNKNLNFLQASI